MTQTHKIVNYYTHTQKTLLLDFVHDKTWVVFLLFPWNFCRTHTQTHPYIHIHTHKHTSVTHTTHTHTHTHTHKQTNNNNNNNNYDYNIYTHRSVYWTHCVEIFDENIVVFLPFVWDFSRTHTQTHIHLYTISHSHIAHTHIHTYLGWMIRVDEHTEIYTILSIIYHRMPTIGKRNTLPFEPDTGGIYLSLSLSLSLV